MSYNCILLDFDETLVSFSQSEHECIAKLYNKYSIPSTEENIRYYHTINEECWSEYEKGNLKKKDLHKKRFQKVIDKFGIKGVSGEALNMEYEHYLKFSAHVIDGAIEFLQDIEDYATVAIVTNGDEETQQNRLRLSGIIEYADGVFTSDSVGYNKPDKRIYTTTLKKLGVENTKSVLVVGDSLYSDIKGGINAGLDTCWVNFNGKENTTDIKPKYTVRDYTELKRIILGDKWEEK